jgi:O-antigen/teichoic acid export membrane protein
MEKSVSSFFTKNFVKAICSQAVTTPINLFLSVFMARFLGPESNGRYILSLQIVSAVVLIAGLGIETAVTYFVGNFKRNHSSSEEVRQWLLSIFYFLLLWIPFSSLIAKVLINFYFQQLDIKSIIYSPVDSIVLLSMATILTTYCRALLLVYDLKIYYLMNIVSVLANAITLTIAITYLKITDVSVIITIQARIVISVLIVYLLVSLKVIAPSSNEKSTVFDLKKIPVIINQANLNIKQIIFFTLKPQAGNIIQYMAYRLDFFMISYIVQENKKIMGYYGVATLLAEGIWFIPGISSLIISNILAQKNVDSSNSIEITIFLTRRILLITFTLAILSIPIMPVVINLAFGSEYIESLKIYYILLPGAVLLSISKPIASYQLSQGRPEISFYVTILSLPIILLSYLSLTAFIGIYGAAIASSVSYATITAIELYYLNKYDAGSVSKLLKLAK